MKTKGRRQSRNVEVQTEKQRVAAGYGLKLQDKVLNSPRALVNEPVAYNQDKTDGEQITSILSNPGKRRSFTKKKGVKDPAPSKMTKDKSYYGDLPFLEHKSKGK